MTRTKRMTAAVLTLVLLLNFAGCGAKNTLFDRVSGAGKFAAESLTIYEEKESFAAEPKTVRDAKQAEVIFGALKDVTLGEVVKTDDKYTRYIFTFADASGSKMSFTLREDGCVVLGGKTYDALGTDTVFEAAGIDPDEETAESKTEASSEASNAQTEPEVTPEPEVTVTPEPTAEPTPEATYTLVDYDGGVFTMQLPQGWQIITGGEYAGYSIRAWDPNDPDVQIFYYGELGPYFKSAEAKAQYQSMSTSNDPLTYLPVLEDPTLAGCLNAMDDYQDAYDGIMPQTVESINHAKAANVKIIVAMNKMDKPTANPERVMEGLTKYGIITEDWGGDVACIPVSALTGMGISDLLERIALEAEVMELKANPNRRAKGAVVEARLDKGQGPIATILVQNGTLHAGDVIIAGTAVGRVRTMRSDKGVLLNDAGPSTPVEITGLTAVPEAGDLFEAVADERLARELAEQRIAAAKEKQFSSFQKVTLDNLFSQMAQNDMKELAIVVKADVQGSAEAVKQSLEKISNDEVRVRVIHAGVGAISKSDVDLADASNAIIIGFNVRPDNVAKEEAAATKVEMRMYRVIYDAINDVTDAMKGMLAPKFREVALGELQVRQVYKISNVGTVAGCRVTSGKITRDSKVRVVRDGIVITEDEIASLKRFKDDAKEVAEGYECGVTLAKFADVKEGDVYEAFKMEEYRD